MAQVEEMSGSILNRTHIHQLHLEHIPQGTPTSKKSIQQECRICLEVDHPDGSELVAPCSCTGSVEYIHAACFKAWLKKKCEDPKARKQILGDEGISCEICKDRYEYSFIINKQCASSTYFCTKLRQQRLFAFANIFFMLLGVALLASVIWFAVTDRENKDYDLKDPRYFMIYIAMLVSVLSLFFGAYHFISHFLVESRLVITPENKTRKGREVKMYRESAEPNKFELTADTLQANSQYLVVRPHNVIASPV